MKHAVIERHPENSKNQMRCRALYVLSDSTGNLARHMLKALLTQFPHDAISIRFVPFIRTANHLDKVLSDASRDEAAICHAMVSSEFKSRISRFCDEREISCRDLTGGTTEFLAKITGVLPQPNVIALHRLDDAYHQRIGALEFTMGHDDGLGLETLCDADIVLVGVSRTSKTPTSIYLAQQGYRVANVSLAMEVAPPAQLLKAPPKKVVGLTINPQQLVMIRTRRESDWQMTRTDYGSPEHVAAEIAWARRLFTAQGWRTLDVTDQAIEETAARISEQFQPPSILGDGTSQGME